MKKKIDTKPKAPFWYEYPEDKASRSKLAMFLRARDREMAKEQEWSMTHVCPKCRIVLTTTGMCPNECGYQMSKDEEIAIVQEKKAQVKKVKIEQAKQTLKDESVDMAAEVQKLMASGMPMQMAIMRVMEGKK